MIVRWPAPSGASWMGAGAWSFKARYTRNRWSGSPARSLGTITIRSTDSWFV